MPDNEEILSPEIASTTPDPETPSESTTDDGAALLPESPSMADGPAGEDGEPGGLIEAMLAVRSMFDGASMPDSMFRDLAILTAFHAMTMTRTGNRPEHFDAAIQGAAGLVRAMINARKEAEKVDKV